jgi:hypothetical protein
VTSTAALGWFAGLGLALARAGTPTGDPMALVVIAATVGLVLADGHGRSITDRLLGPLAGGVSAARASGIAAASPLRPVTVDPSGRATTQRLSVLRA